MWLLVQKQNYIYPRNDKWWVKPGQIKQAKKGWAIYLQKLGQTVLVKVSDVLF